MSTGSKVAVGVSIVATISVIAGVHIQKHLDRKRLREGVYKDIERQDRKKQNILELEKQIELTKILTEERDKREREAALASTIKQS
ncbi:protein PET117 homolog, mitochondrial-like [Amphiura filiformis]|uniref:protein PET117 homolog, mitochondrial-like n=1 Tax=Amphiura filiformis TaxID=82378 RepID=UPI003B218014